MKTVILTSFVICGCVSAMPVFIGTLGGKDNGARGIYRADFDPQTGSLTQPTLAAECQNPGFLTQHPTKPVIYAVGRKNQLFAGGPHSVAAFSVGGSHDLTLLGELASGGQGPCHLAVDQSGRALAVANYGDGAVAIFRLDEHGTLLALHSLLTHAGSGPVKSRQSGPHAHGVYFDKSNSFLFVPDLGLDKVHVYPFKPAEGPLDPATTLNPDDPLPPLATAPGAGPRHMAFSPDQRHAYVVNELDNTILAARYDGKGGFKPIHAVPTLPADFKGANTTAEIEVSADGRFVHVSNRGHDSIAVLRRDAESGKLALIQHAPCGGKHPRHFKISPCGKWLLCGHMDSNTISVLPRDPENGRLGDPVRTVSSPGPTCLLFAR